MSQRIRLVLADDHACLRGAMAEMLTRSNEFEVVAEISDAAAAVAAARSHRPDLVVLDVDMPGQSSFVAAKEIQAVSEPPRVVFLSGYCSDRYIREAMAVRAAGYITKTESTERLLEALKRVASGATYFSPDVEQRLTAEMGTGHNGTATKQITASLTDREVEVLGHIARGLSKREIAKLLFLSPRTVERHVANTMAKLDIHDRVGLARFAIRERMVEP